MGTPTPLITAGTLGEYDVVYADEIGALRTAYVVHPLSGQLVALGHVVLTPRTDTPDVWTWKEIGRDLPDVRFENPNDAALALARKVLASWNLSAV